MQNDKRSLRIVYMGTPAFAVEGLQLLLQKGYAVVGVLTAPDRPAGRGQKLRESAVKVFAKANGLKILQPTNLKGESFLVELKALNANLQIVVAFRMLPKAVWQMPEYGTFNLHASLLPNYRGAAPINWAIMNGETQTGATTFFIDEKIDTGEIIHQEKISIHKEENAGQLHDRLMVLGGKLILKTVRSIETQTANPQKQPTAKALKGAPKIHKETCEIDWSWPLNSVYDHIRGLSPYPAAWTTLINANKEYLLKIYAASKHHLAHQHKIGSIGYDKGGMRIYTKGGFLQITELQLAGKRKMGVKELLNGFTIDANAYVR